MGHIKIKMVYNSVTFLWGIQSFSVDVTQSAQPVPVRHFCGIFCLWSKRNQCMAQVLSLLCTLPFSAVFIVFILGRHEIFNVSQTHV